MLHRIIKLLPVKYLIVFSIVSKAVFISEITISQLYNSQSVCATINEPIRMISYNNYAFEEEYNLDAIRTIESATPNEETFKECDERSILSKKTSYRAKLMLYCFCVILLNLCLLSILFWAITMRENNIANFFSIMFILQIVSSWFCFAYFSGN